MEQTLFLDKTSDLVLVKYQQATYSFSAIFFTNDIAQAEKDFRRIYNLHPKDKIDLKDYPAVDNYSINSDGNITQTNHYHFLYDK